MFQFSMKLNMDETSIASDQSRPVLMPKITGVIGSRIKRLQAANQAHEGPL